MRTFRPKPAIDLNDEFRRALEIMENTQRSLFVTGRAGTGKSTLLDYFRNSTRKKVAVLAPTGVAALNVRGQTIHSFFRFKLDITIDRVKKERFKSQKENPYRSLDAIVMILIGDLYQLPPVVSGAEKGIFSSLYQSPYFYSANVFADFRMEFIELEKVYRQHDEDFIGLLNSIRNNSVTEEGLRELNSRCRPDFLPPPGQFYVYLTTTNAVADAVNEERLARLKGRLHSFTADIQGNFGKEYLPTRIELSVKVGSQVMMLNNDSLGRWVNGTIGKITGFEANDEGHTAIIAELADGENVEILPHTWEIFQFFAEGGQLRSEVVGRFTQYPLTLAWAITIHKSQGKTFERVIIDIGKGTFAHGQAYVALSRCTSLEGIVLKKPFELKHIWCDWRVRKFLTGLQYGKAEEASPLAGKLEMIKQAIAEGASLRIVYLKPNDEKSTRMVIPRSVGEMEYAGKKYLGMRAFCLKRNEERSFRVDRILEMRGEE